MNSDDGFPFIGILVFMVVGIVLTMALLLSPFILLGLAIIIPFMIWDANPAKQEQDKKNETVELYETVLALYKPRDVDWRLPRPFIPIAEEIIAIEGYNQEIPPPPAMLNSFGGAKYRDMLRKLIEQSPRSFHRIQDCIQESFFPITRHISEEESSDYSIPIEYFLEDIPDTVEEVILPLHRGEGFPITRRKLDDNLREQDSIYPTKYKGDDVVTEYLRGTPLTKLFNQSVPFSIPDNFREQHHFILGGTGHGKTQCMQTFIAKDIEKVKRGEASMVVIDSQGDLINKIRNLRGLTPRNTVIIDPEDVEFPVCLNLFDVNQERLESYGQLARERQLNGVIELYDYVLGSLLSADMTQKQSVIFRYVIRLLLLIPNATIHTMLDLFRDGQISEYDEYISQLDQTAQTFFVEEFTGREFAQTRKQVVRRLYGILENQSFNRMFSHPKSKLDLFTEMNDGKLILINTSKSLLKEEGTEVFGRFFIAMLTQAAQEREEIDPSARKPCYVYIDEANDYRFDEKIDLILTQARKYRVGLCMATQYLDKISPKLQAAIAANTAIKFAGGASNRDARRMAPDMKCDYEFIENQPSLTFAVHVRGLTAKAVPLKFEPGYLEKLPKASPDEVRTLREAMRERYAVPLREAIAKPPEPEPEETPDDFDDEQSQGGRNASWDLKPTKTYYRRDGGPKPTKPAARPKAGDDEEKPGDW